MDTFVENDLRTLAEKHDDYCVSIFMPTHRGQDTQQDRIRLKNLLKDAEERLLEKGMRMSDVEKLLEPAERLLPDGLFWTYKSDGLALFMSPMFFRYYRLPLSFEQELIVTDRFHIKPVLPMLMGDGTFFLLTLGRNRVRFFEGTRYKITELNVKDLPKSFAEALNYLDIEKQLQYHTGSSASRSGKRSPMFHGQGVGSELDKEYTREYFDQIDPVLHEVLRDRRDPLILAGVEYLFPIYREANSYQHLLAEGVAGNPEEQTPQELHKHAWPIAEKYFMKELEERLGQYDVLVGAGRTSNDVKEIVSAAYSGRVDCLFVAPNGKVCGRFDPASGEVNLHQEVGHCEEDLVDFAAVQTILHGGSVYPMQADQVPGGPPVAAVFRY